MKPTTVLRQVLRENCCQARNSHEILILTLLDEKRFHGCPVVFPGGEKRGDIWR
jgi:hypothetical protein